MSTAKHSWRTSRRQFDRLVLGATVAFSFTLVAFEWRMPKTEIFVPVSLEDEGLPIEVLPVVILKEKSAEQPVTRRRSSDRIVFAEPIVPVTPDPGPTPEPGPSPDPAPSPDPSALRRTEPVDETPRPWGSIGVNPYFVDCLERDKHDLVSCTEERIGQHLQRNFKIPSGIRGQVRTTVTFLIDTKGDISKIVCAPRVDAAVFAEIERTLRSMPQFVPGSQGGIPVPVYYQIPLSLRSE